MSRTLPHARSFFSLAKLALLAAVAAAFLAPGAFAQETWDGGGGDNNFGTDANWADDSAPATSSGVVLNFGGGTQPTPNNNYNTGDNFGEWHLLNTATTDFTISGNGFGLYGKIENDAASGHTFTINTAGIYARDNEIQLNPVGGNMVIGAAIELDNNATLNVYDGSNSRTLTLNGALSNGNGTGGNGQIILNQTATVVLAADSDYGGTTLNAGTKLYVGTGGTTGTLGVGNTANAGALYFNRSNAYTYGGVISGAGTVTQQGSGTLTLSGSNSYSGGTTINAGTLSINAANGVGSGGITINASGTLATTAAMTITAAISGTGAMTHSSGNLVLSGTNTFSGTATVTGGNLIFTNEASENGAPSVALNGGSLVLGGAFAGKTATIGSLSGNSSFSSINPAYEAATGTRTLSVNQTADGTFLGKIEVGSSSRDIALVKTGSAKLTLSGINTYTGGTTVNGGTLRLTKSSSGTGTIRGTLSAGTGTTIEIGGTDVLGYSTGSDAVRTINLNGATLVQTQNRNETNTAVINMAGGSTISATGGTSALFDMFGGTAAINASGDAQNTISSPIRFRKDNTTFTVADGAAATDLLVSGVISANASSETYKGALTKAGAGTMLLFGANTFTGDVTVNAGVIKIGNKSALGASNTAVSKVVVASGAAVDFNGVADATYGYTIAGAGVGGTGALTNSAGNIGNGSAQTSNIKLSDNASIGGSGNWALLASGWGGTTLDMGGYTLTKTGSNTINLCNTTISNGGTIQVSQGTLGTVQYGSVGSSTALILDNTSGVGLNLGANLVIGSLSGGGAAGGNVASSATLSVGALNTDTTYAGVISGTGALTKTGTGTLALSGASTYTGNTTVSTGTLDLTAGRLYSGGYESNAVVTVNGGTLLLNSFAYNLTAASLGGLRDYANARVINGGTIEVIGGTHSSGNDFTVGTNGGTFRYKPANTADTLTLSGNNNSNIPIAGALTFQADGNITVSEVIEGAGSLIKTGDQTVLLNRTDNSFSGNITVNAGTLTGIGNATSAGTTSAFGSKSSSRSITVKSGATLWLTQTTGSSNTFGGSGMTASQIPTLVIDGGSVYTGKFNTIGNVTMRNGGGLINSSQEPGGSYMAYQFIGDITVDGSGTGVTMSNSGNHAYSPGNHLKGGGTTTFTVADITGSSAADLTISSSLRDGSPDYAGAGALVKAGAGTMVLSAANTYTGTTSVNAGTLVVGDGTSGSLSDTAVTVASGATLMGSGTIGSASTAGASVTIQSGGTHSPGNSAAIQQINGSTTYASTSIFVWELYANTTSNSPTVYYDQVNITGSLKIDDGALFNVVLNDTGSTVNLADTFWQQIRQWQVFSSTGNLTYTNGFTLNTVSSAQTPVSNYGSFSFTYDPSKKVYLNWTPVPELSNLLVGGLLAVGLLRRRRATEGAGGAQC